jgi:ankyrin repeat protein
MPTTSSRTPQQEDPPAARAGEKHKEPSINDFGQLIDQEVSKDKNSCALIAAARNGDRDFASLALRHGDDVNQQNTEGKTALHVAIQCGKKDIALWLLSRGADPYIADKRGQDCSAWADEATGLKAAKQVIWQRISRYFFWAGMLACSVCFSLLCNL